jgi:hypothetical protein
MHPKQRATGQTARPGPRLEFFGVVYLVVFEFFGLALKNVIVVLGHLSSS